MKNLRFFLFLICFSGLLATCRKAPTGPLYQAEKSKVADSAMVVSPHPLASGIGVDVLKKGGNAIDATVAVQFALAVVYPRAGNIGGGGFMVIRHADGSAITLDYREKAPLVAGRDMYLDSTGAVIEGLSRNGQLAAGVPGTVAGLLTAHRKYGQIPLEQLLNPAIKLARRGFAISASEAERLNRYQEDFRRYNQAPNPFLKTEWKAGDLLVQKELAHTLSLIRDQGKAGFYEGETANDIVREMQSGNGIISYEDLKKYQPKWREPVVGFYKNYKVISMPPPSSGGVALIQMLNMVEPYPLGEWGFHRTISIHLMAEAERRAYADRAEYLGDMDFYPVPVDSLIDEKYLAERMADFSLDSATTSQSIIAGDFTVALETFETTHTSVVDQEGHAVSTTTTLNSNYGCKVWVDEAGFFLNNEMDDFSAKPGVPNQFGLIGAEANSIKPEKRMLSSMTPTIIEKDNKLFLVLGTPGGSTIITSVFQVFLNVAEFDMDLEQAVNAGRFHHQWLPDHVMVEENTLADSTLQALRALGHKIEMKDNVAKIKVIKVRPDGKLHGVGDRRNPDDDVEGY